ncbi:MAG: molybdopterin cofactor-binding domain-containing protein, partial [Pseudomonadota bacterium]|nr:molybdopterin cofactor-binding domain-containing protein [Pseudomonadota bacterium]
MNKHVMDKAIGETRLDRNTQGIIGKGVDRYEGPLKVSGRATYAYENLAGEDVAYGFVVPAPIGRGAIKSVDTSKAESAPGVLAVISGDKILRASSQPMAPAAQTIDGEVFHYNQPLAIVIAESFEAARHASHLVTADYEPKQGRYDVKARETVRKPDAMPMEPVNERGDFEKAFAEAEVQFDETYTTPSYHAAAMEPHASVAKWDGDRLTVWSSCQLLETNVKQIAAGVGLDVSKVRLHSPYLGG